MFTYIPLKEFRNSCITQVWKQTSCNSCATNRADRGVCSAVFITIVLPHASAGPTFQANMRRGKFHGIIWPATPIGSCRTCTWCGPSAGTIRPCILSAQPVTIQSKMQLSTKQQQQQHHQTQLSNITSIISNQAGHHGNLNLSWLLIRLPIVPSLKGRNLIIVFLNQISKTIENTRSFLKEYDKIWFIIECYNNSSSFSKKLINRRQERTEWSKS